MKISDYFPHDVFADRTIFITDGSSGINLGTAKSFTAIGANIEFRGRTEEKLGNAKSELEE